MAKPSQRKTIQQFLSSASILSIGNILSRLLGLARETLQSRFFGATGAVDAFNIASDVPTLLYDLLIRGMVESALIPVFSTYSSADLEQLMGATITLVLLLFTIITAVLEIAAPQIAMVLNAGASPAVVTLTVQLLRITIPTLLFLSLSGVFSAFLYSRKRFIFPAFAVAIFNAGIVGTTVFLHIALHGALGIGVMALGVLLGGILQLSLQIAGFYREHPTLRLRLWHPGLPRLLTLYAPIMLGLLVDVLFSRPLSYNLASRTGEGSISIMNYALTLRQMPEGVITLAISLAVLPVLAKQRHEIAAFRESLAAGLRLVIVIILPVTLGLIILAVPLVQIIFQHGSFTAADTTVTAQALQYYLLGLPFAGIDSLLVFAFYARQNTVTPALIGVGAAFVYAGVALLLLPQIGLLSLMVADAVKLIFHVVISSALLRRHASHY